MRHAAVCRKNRSEQGASKQLHSFDAREQDKGRPAETGEQAGQRASTLLCHSFHWRCHRVGGTTATALSALGGGAWPRSSSEYARVADDTGASGRMAAATCARMRFVKVNTQHRLQAVRARLGFRPRTLFDTFWVVWRSLRWGVLTTIACQLACADILVA